MSSGSDQGIHDAAADGNLSAVRRLIHAGESPDTPWISGWNVLPYLVVSRAPVAGLLRVGVYLLGGGHLHVAPLLTPAAVRDRGIGGLVAIATGAAAHANPRIKLAAYCWRHELVAYRRAAEERAKAKPEEKLIHIPISVPSTPPVLPRVAQADLDWLASSTSVHWSSHPLLMTLLAALGSAVPAPSTPSAAAASSASGAASP